MARHAEFDTEAVNADSFLDIVASIVSIMIIMVLMTGLKIKHAPATPAMIEEAASKTGSGLDTELAIEQSLRADVVKMAGDMEQMQRDLAARKQHRDMLAQGVTTLRQEIEAVNRQSAAKNDAEALLGFETTAARSRLEDLERARIAIETAPQPPIAVQSYPTPIGRTVDGREVHFQLRSGRVAFVPLDELVRVFQSDAQQKIHRLRDASEMTETIGPVGGFRLRYTMERVEANAASGRVGAYAQLRRWTLIPISDDLGEPIDQALAEGSELRSVLAERRARGATVTVWTYSDSFDAFRRLKAELYRLEFPTACRPLPDGVSISGSPDGTKSAAE